LTGLAAETAFLTVFLGSVVVFLVIFGIKF
jgi:hypothetical protein